MTARSIFICSALLAAITSRAAAQDPVVDSGARVRISTDSAAIVGSLVKADSIGFWVTSDSSAERTFVRRWSVKKLEVSLGTKSHSGDGALVGFLLGAATGVVTGLAEGSDPPGAWFGLSAGDKAGILGVFLGGVGAGLGALIGLGATEDDWHEYHPSDVHFAFRASPRGAGLGVSISF